MKRGWLFLGFAVASAGSGALAIAAPPTTAPANAAPVASARFDLDRDGAAEDLRIERDGMFAVVSGRTGGVLARKPLAASPGGRAAKGAIDIATGAAVGGRVVILAVATWAGAGGRGEALAAEWRGGLHELWRGAVGPVGADGESTLYVEAGRYGLLRYSGRAGVARCDGRTAHLYAEKFDFAPGGGGRFRAVDQMPRIPDDAPELVATRATPFAGAEAARPIDFRALAASSQSGAGGAGELVAPQEIDDRDPATAWVEGRSGFGRGEFVTARASLDGGMVRAIRIVPGHAGSARSFLQSNRLKRIGLLVGRERVFRVVFARDPAGQGGPGDPYWIALPEPIGADCVSVVVMEVYFGPAARGAGHTAIAELAVLTEMDLAPGGAAAQLAAQVAGGGRAGEQAARVLVRLGGAAESALLAEVQRPGAAAEAIVRLRRVLADLPAGAAELAAGLAAADVHPADGERFAAALVAIGRPAIEPVAEILASRTGGDDGRGRAAQVLGGIRDPGALRALAAAAGSGSRQLRRAVAIAIGSRPPAELDAVIALAGAAAQESEGREADLWRAVGLIARAPSAAAARKRVAAALTARLAAARGYELRYRLLEAAASLDEPALVAEVARELENGGGARAEVGSTRARRGTPAREGGAETARDGSNPTSGVVGSDQAPVSSQNANNGKRATGGGQLATGNERGGSPTRAERAALRRVAAGVLARSRAASATGALVRAARDPDPGVREAAGAALGARGLAGGDSALISQLAGDRWPRVRRGAATALGGVCRRPAPAGALRRAALTDRDVDVRRAALTSLVACSADGAIRFLLAVAADRGAPGELRIHAIRLIGSSGESRAARALVPLVSAELERVFSAEGAASVAATGVYALGQLGDPAALPVLLRAAEAVAFPELQAAAASSLGRLCPPAAIPVLRDLAAAGQHRVSAPARAALRRCSR